MPVLWILDLSSQQNSGRSARCNEDLGALGSWSFVAVIIFINARYPKCIFFPSCRDPWKFGILARRYPSLRTFKFSPSCPPNLHFFSTHPSPSSIEFLPFPCAAWPKPYRLYRNSPSFEVHLAASPNKIIPPHCSSFERQTRNGFNRGASTGRLSKDGHFYHGRLCTFDGCWVTK